jgi:hypothetical protein
MPPKAKIPAPIDRPLSRAYLREFTGWSTAYPPGLSDPTSLRLMENVQINRDGSARVRPGLRFISYDNLPVYAGEELVTPGVANGGVPVSAHETFFLNDGTKAYLYAVNEPLGVGFRVLTDTGLGLLVHELDYPGIDFTFEPDYDTVCFSADTTYVKFLQIDNKILALSNAGENIRVFYVGADKHAKKIVSIAEPAWTLADKLTVTHPATSEYPEPLALPVVESIRTAETLISSTDTDNVYNFGYFYTFSNDIGESAASQVTQVKAQRAFSSWAFVTPDPAIITGANEPGSLDGERTDDPTAVSDQLIAFMPEAVYDAAKASGATKWTLFMFTWSDTDSVPVDALIVDTKEITVAGVYEDQGWIRHTPVLNGGALVSPIPTLASRYNYSDPSKAAQGIVAADRLVLVNDPTAAAVIRWSSNQQAEYLNFTARLGGGYKTLTSGNLMIPACVKLWQNPQSVDTLTVLCMGVDGHSTGYYMAPASVQSQADAVPIMGFEETTATPGTVSPYGVEVLNNALFHPLDTELMKSTAANYNINHKTQTEQIENMWRGLLDKHHIVSSQHDNRLYYIVNNPYGEALEDGCFGNEIWVFDAGKDSGTWSRWLIQAKSLRKVEQGGLVHMSVIRPDGIYYLDDAYSSDDYVDELGDVLSRPIPWLLETNTQGANRAHDALCNLQQANIVVGNFQGTMRYGVKGWDRHGKPFDVSKIVVDELAPGDLPYDLQDFLLVRKDAAEWFFYAQSVEVEGEVLPSAGQLSLVQYRYSPLSVNAGFEHGSVETYEYGRVVAGSATQNTVNGTPVPMIDVRRP